MSTSQTRRPWDASFEQDMFSRLTPTHAPHLPATKGHTARDPQTPEEIELVVEYLTRLAAHDTFIVQVCSRAFASLELDLDFQLKLARQIGDDGHHAVLARDGVKLLTGKDPIDKIDEYVREHWEALGDLPIRDWFGFLAFQFHYELHIQARLYAESRTNKITVASVFSKFRSEYAFEDEAGDELIHRIYVVEWLQKKLDAATPAERADWKQRLLAADEEVQRRLNPYLRYRVFNGGEAWGADTRNSVELYDAWRREVLAYLLEEPVAELPELVSLAA